MAICRTNLQHHMAEYIEFKIFEATQGGTKTSPDLSKEEVASVWQEADADRRKTCDGRDWKLAGSKRTYAGVPDWSHHALRREGNRRVKKKNSQDRPEVRSSPLQGIFGIFPIPSITPGTSVGGT